MVTYLLPNEPRIVQPALEQRLTEQHLLPALPELEVLLWEVRLGLDPILQAQQPVKLGKPYPLGQCLEIAEAVQVRLRSIKPAELTPNAAQGLRALRQFQQAGGSLRQVWGDLRGQYFQNAFQVGTLYIDVANDTVTPTKPKIEILPFHQADFHPIRDYLHYRQISTAYWKEPVYPNHILPDIAPFSPLILVAGDGRVKWLDQSQYMVTLTLQSRFQASVSALQDTPMPVAVFQALSQRLRDLGYQPAPSLEQGQQHALKTCQDRARKRWHANSPGVSRAIQTVLQLNRHLAQSSAPRVESSVAHPTSSKPSMSTLHEPTTPTTHLTIDGRTVDVSRLSPEAKQQLEMIRRCDQRLQELRIEELVETGNKSWRFRNSSAKVKWAKPKHWLQS